MYEGLAGLYDWEHQDFRDDIQVYLGFASSFPGPVLDAACGTGRVLVPLAKAGHSVVGIDASGDMLAAARSYASREGVESRVSLVQGDLRTMDLPQRFGLAFVALGSFHHLLSRQDQVAALERLAAHVVPGGMLILDLINPNPGWLSAGDGVPVLQHSGPYPGPDGPDWLAKFVVRTTSFENQRDESILIYDRTDPSGVLTRRTVRMEMRLLFRYESEGLLLGAGFTTRSLHGDYDLGDYLSSSSRMIFVAERQ